MAASKVNVGIVSLGCPRNLVDSEYTLGRLQKRNARITDIAKADIAIVNTCAFIEDAKRESIDAILDLIDLKKSGRLKKIIVQGCLVQRYARQLRRQFPEVDSFVGAVSLTRGTSRCALTPAHYAYLKICEGCVNFCSFCIIPKLKGRLSSLPIADIEAKAAALNRQGIAELNIIGQDSTGYGLDLYGRPRLEHCLRRILARTPRIGWVRLLYLHPARITDELLRIIRDNPRVCKYVDLPVQHISARVLKRMRRSPGPRQIRAHLEKVRKLLPCAAIRTSVIVGFPGETENDFKALCSFIEEERFERLGAFIYSREEETPAADLPGQLPLAVKQERFNRVMALQQEVSEQNNRRLLDKEIRVLIEEKEKGYYLARSEYDAPEVDGQVFVRTKKSFSPGDFVTVRIIDTMEYDLVGEPVHEHRQ